eukprot:scpid36679/ scgid21233/ Dimethylaniline monooxygenase [N-oxide-forming] 5; Dimethylaniline oxidase 5; Hepatic flavin-containing monooxygenase 5
MSRWLVVIPVLLPQSAAVCYFLFPNVSLIGLLAASAAFPLLVAALASKNPEIIMLVLLPFLAIYQAFSLLSEPIRKFFSPPDIRYVAKGKVKRVAVIGAGSAGITAAKEAMQAGLDVVIFEQTAAIGGNWVFREEEAHSSVYRSTVINTTKQMNAFSDYPMPDETATFPHHSELVKYFNNYAEHFDVVSKVRFHTKVVDVQLISQDRWRVVSRETDPDEVGKPDEKNAKVRSDCESPVPDPSQHITEEYDAVMVCNGHHHQPLWPDFPGQEKFKGHVIHSHSYKDPTSCGKGFNYHNKRVLVVGVGNSGADIAVELSRVTEKLYLSTRTGLWVLPKFVDGMALDHTWTTNRLIQMCLPEAFTHSSFFTWLFSDVVEYKITKSQGDMKAWGMRPKYRAVQSHTTVNQDLLHRIGVGSIAMQDNVREVLEDGVVFEDGSVVQLDAIIFSTGYLIRFPFLSKAISPVNDENHIRLHHFMINPKHSPTMVFIGFIQPVGALMPISELQARWAVQIFTGERGIPKPEELERRISSRLNELWKVFLRRPRHTTESLYSPIVEALAEEIGCVPRLWNPRNWKVLKELLLSPHGWSVTYRLQGPGKWTGAASALKKAYNQMGQFP